MSNSEENNSKCSNNCCSMSKDGSCGLTTKIEKTRVRRKSYSMDLRIQSPESLGHIGVNGLKTAPALVRLARIKGLDLISITDYYSGEYIDQVLEAAHDTPLTVLPGVMCRCSIEGCDDVNILCLFSEESKGGTVSNFLTDLGIPSEAARNRSYIIEADFKTFLKTVEKHGAIAVPSRMDKTPYRKLAIPTLVEEYGFRAFDLAYYPDSTKLFEDRWPDKDFHLFCFSNAHSLAQVGSKISKIKMIQPGFEGLKQITGREELQQG